MNNQGTFTISLDCEGKWGVADHLSGICNKINDRSLSEVYSYIYDALNFNDIKVTAAFTSLFSVELNVINSYYDQIKEFRDQGYSWFSPIVDFIYNEDYDGWIGEDFFKRAVNDGHEIGWHGSTHHSLGNLTQEKIIDFELKIAFDIASLNLIKLKSLVFPRNEIGHIDKFEVSGFNFYRNFQHEKNNSKFLKYTRVLDEFNIFKKSQIFDNLENLNKFKKLPSGYFLNWPSGPRGLVPDEVTIRRWLSILNHAADNGGHVHLWFHPHNFITAPRMKRVFSIILMEASRLIKSGRLVNKKMSDF